ncbi:RNA-binding protein [Mesorhizobium sp. M0092]|uniref:RNA-binding protein n=1 Tax=unclassified Mesorhizobium TaxID=325217 RepID=UPI00333CDFCE
MADKHPKRPRDPNQLAKSIVALATGESEDKKPLTSAVKGGTARAKSLTPKQRAEIAKVAAEARWKKSS